MRTVACIIARTASTRLPNKVLMEINGKKLIEYIIEKMKNVSNLDAIYLCTSIDDDDQILLDIAKKNGIKSYAGSRKSVIDRMLDVAKMENADNVVRVTGDNVFTDEFFLDRMIEEHNNHPMMDYTRTEYLPLGVTAEVINVSALERCYEMIDPEKSEYLMLYMFNPEEFNCQVLIPEESLMAEYSSLTVDTHEDFERTEFLIDRLYKNNRLYYDDIIKLNNKKKIPYFNIDKNLLVRMPNNNAITYAKFRRSIIEQRINRSKKVVLEVNFYENQRDN
jgi:spore coat polysaccharide biosynthesis protein SpsF